MNLYRAGNLLFTVTLVLIGVALWSGCSRSEAKRGRPLDYLGRIKTSLGMFDVDIGRYPTTEEGLGVLITKPADVPVAEWHGPYLTEKDLKDQWGHELVYRCPGIHNPATYDLHSMGPDGKHGTEDDIRNWAVSGK